MNLESFTLDELRFEMSKRDLGIRLLVSASPQMDRLEAERQAFEDEINRRTSIFRPKGDV